MIHMKYISKIIGALNISDLNIVLSENETIDLSNEDLKSSYELRELIRKKLLVPYDPKIHRYTKEIKRIINPTVTDNSELGNYIKLLDVKIDKLINKVNQLTLKSEPDGKIDMLLEKMEQLLAKEVSIQKDIWKTTPKIQETLKKVFDDNILVIPDINLSDISNKNIVTKDAESQGTDDILEQLKKMKNKE